MSARTFVTGLVHHVRASVVLMARAGRDRQAREALVALRRAADGYALPTREVWPESPMQVTFLPPRRWANISDYEAFILAALVIEATPSAVFEFGTFDGYSAWIIARNSGATVYTLDLPLGQIPAGGVAGDREAAAKRAQAGGAGPLVRSDPRVIQLLGDSATFDFSPYAGKMDFVFVDGNHSRAYIESDTGNALAMVKPGGMVVWHDCDRRHLHVWRHLTRLAERLPIRSVPGTRFAVLAGVL